jgi:CheY-like chemotaxis protein
MHSGLVTHFLQINRAQHRVGMVNAANCYWFGSEGLMSSSPSAERRLPMTSLQPARVLIVEDELFVAWHLESLVRDLKYDVCGLVPDGEGAVEQASDLEADLILMDISLSGEMDGIEAARRIRQDRDTPIIFITAYSDAATLERIKQRVPNAPVLAKPISAERLRTAIASVLQGRQSQDR